MHCCPHAGCDYRGWLGLGHLRANGHPSGGPWRQLSWRSCHGYFLETQGTLLHGKRLSEWLAEAAAQLEACTSYFLCDMHVTQRQLDELYAVSRALKTGEISADAALKRLAGARPWVWTAIDPVSKVRLAIAVGPRTVEMAQRVVHQVAQRIASSCMPLWLSDGVTGYLPAILGHCGVWQQPERTRAQGPAPKPRWRPLPGVLYAQVGKQYRRKRMVGVKHRVVFGTRGAIAQVLSVYGGKINTAFVERLPLDIRQRVAAIGRRVNTLCQDEDGLQHQLAVFHAYHNVVLPHARLRQPLRIPEPTNGTGSAKRWRPCTPAMAAGLTDHVWTLRDVLLLRVPPWPQPHVA
jgi:IS1 family transposase